jgi:hypothetical protein
MGNEICAETSHQQLTDITFPIMFTNRAQMCWGSRNSLSNWICFAWDDTTMPIGDLIGTSSFINDSPFIPLDQLNNGDYTSSSGYSPTP